MLAIPSIGAFRAAEVQNLRLAPLCDWLEANLLFEKDAQLSASDAVDALCEEQFATKQDLAWRRLDDAWNELGRREISLGKGSPFEVQKRRLRRKGNWRDYPAHSFCLALSLVTCYPRWANSFGQDYTEQGELFELLTTESFKLNFYGWNVSSTGWTRTNSNKLATVVENLATELGEKKGDYKYWAKQQSNELGLDLVCYRPFPDGRVGRPVFLMQCASGRDWEKKLRTPPIDLWQKIVEFAASPARAFSIPFALDHDDFIKACPRIEGMMLLDRNRLLSPGRAKPDWVSTSLKTRLVKWLRPRLLNLPKTN